MQDTGNLWDVKHTCGQAGSLTHVALKQPAQQQTPLDIVAGGVHGSFWTRFRTGWARVRAGAPQGEGIGHRRPVVNTHIQTCAQIQIHTHVVAPSGTEYCHYLSLLSIVCVCVCVDLWQFHHPHSQIHSSVACSSLQPGCVSNWHSNWQIWMPPLDG